MTNHEWIKNMSNKELVQFLFNGRAIVCNYCKFNDDCDWVSNSDCMEIIEDWLSEEHKEEEE